MARELGDFSAMAQAVWAEPTVAGKQEKILVMIGECRSKEEKKAAFRRSLAGMTNATRLDRFAADLMLVDTDRRIK